MRRRMASIFRTTARRTEGRKCTPAGLKCIIPVDILMYVWAWSKGKIPSETKVRKGGEMVMFVFICPLLGETCAHCFNRTWITIAGDAWADLTLRHVVDSFGSRLILSHHFALALTLMSPLKKQKNKNETTSHSRRIALSRSVTDSLALIFAPSAIYCLSNATFVYSNLEWGCIN